VDPSFTINSIHDMYCYDGEAMIRKLKSEGYYFII
jgi:hypothetical protein